VGLASEQAPSQAVPSGGRSLSEPKCLLAASITRSWLLGLAGNRHVQQQQPLICQACDS
jgi:hypothetical protein